MKRIILSIALLLGACTAAQQQTATADLAKLQTAVVQGCEVIQPTLQSIGALDPSVTAVATANGLFCATASSITVTSVQSLLATGIPAVDAAINASTFIPANQKPLLIAAIGIGQLTIQNALAIFNNATATATPAATAK
jgi:hypothetical protein